MKKANKKLDLINDKAEKFDENVLLQNISPGHYCIPINDVQIPIQGTFIDKYKEQNKDKNKNIIDKYISHVIFV